MRGTEMEYGKEQEMEMQKEQEIEVQQEQEVKTETEQKQETADRQNQYQNSEQQVNQETQTNEKQKEQSIIRHKDGEVTINFLSLKGKIDKIKNKAQEKVQKNTQKALPVLIPIKEKVLAKRKLVVRGAIALIAIIVTMSIIASNSGYRGVLKGMVRTVNSREVDLSRIADAVLPQSMSECYSETMGIIGDISMVQSAVEDLEEDIDDQYVRLDNLFGSNAKISVKVLEKEKMSQSQLRKTQNDYKNYYSNYLQSCINEIDEYDYEDIKHLAEKYDLTSSEITEIRENIDELGEYLKNMRVTWGYNLKVQLKVKGSKDSYSTEVNLRVIKANGEWMVDYMTLDNGMNMLQKFGNGLSSLIWFL